MHTRIFIVLLLLGTNSFIQSQAVDPEILGELSPDEIETLMGALGTGIDTEDTGEDLEVIDEDETLLDELEIEDSNILEGRKFGYDFFSTIPTSTSAVGDLPLPNDYKISLRDKFTVILSGSKESIFDLNVKLDGTILFPEIGSISVAGETFQAVKEKISSLINQSYVGVKVDLSIKNLSVKKITIVGAVKAPGTYLVNPFSTITSSLAYSGGISEIGTLRKIKLIRSNGEVFSFDLYELLVKGNRKNDITIESGDTILIESASQFIELLGSVKRPGVYEVLPSDTIEDLINYGLGFKNTSNKTNLSLTRLDTENSVITQFETNNLEKDLKDILTVEVFDYQSVDESNIFVSGAVARPGFYDVNSFQTLEELIKTLEFVDVYPWMATLEQFDSDSLLKESILFSLNDKETYRAITLKPNARIYFSSIDERTFIAEDMTLDKIEEYSLTINHKTGEFVLPIIGSFSVPKLTDLLGLDMADVDNIATYVSPLDNLVVTSNYQEMTFKANKYNAITFKAKSNDLIRISISGAIDFPGIYTLKSDATLQDLYNLVGGFKNIAFEEGIIILRESVRERQIEALEKAKNDLNEAILANLQKGENVVSPDLISSLSLEINEERLGRVAGDFSPNSRASKSTTLFDGDEIIVPKISNSVIVLGEVLSPTNFLYTKNLNLQRAIENAGGYKEFADRKRTYIIKPDGTIQKAGRSVFGAGSNIGAGDTIVVPRKLIISSNADFLAPITQIISDLSFSAAAIQNLSNN